MPSPASRGLLLARVLRTRMLTATPPSSSSSLAPILDKKGHLHCESKDHQSFEDSRNCHPRKKIPLVSSCCFAAAGLIAFSTMPLEPLALHLEEEKSKGIEASTFSAPNPRIIFVLGGPGSGKGTQCASLVERYGFTHLSAGDLLRAEINSGSEDGEMVRNMIKEGKIVPSEVTVKLLQKAMKESGNNKFLIDGFPRNNENRSSFENIAGIEPEFILYFDCPEEEMERRLLTRNQGREDDNQETIKKRFRVFRESTLPVVQYYELKGKVKKIDASGTIEEVRKSLEHLFLPFVQEDLLQLTKDLLKSIDEGDYGTYSRLCNSELTAFEPESKGHLVDGMEFHKFYFNAKSPLYARSDISSAKVVLVGENTGIVMYTRLCQSTGGIQNVDDVKPFNETRVWARKKNVNGQWEWKLVHYHKSNA